MKVGAPGRPRGLTPTGQKTSQKIRDRLRKQATRTIARPKPVDPPPRPKAGEWRPPAWLVQTLTESGKVHLLDKPPERPTTIPNTSSSMSQSASSTDNPGMVDRPCTVRRPRSGIDEISLTQAVDEYCNSTNEDEESNQEDVRGDDTNANVEYPNQGEGPPGAQVAPESLQQEAPRTLLFSGIYK